MRLLHAAGKTRASFDDPNLVSHAGLVPAMRLAELVGLENLAAHHVRVNARVDANAGAKIGSLIVGADDIDGMDLLRHGALPATFGEIRGPSTLWSFLRAFTHGNVRQLAAVHRRVFVYPAGGTSDHHQPAAASLVASAIITAQRRRGERADRGARRLGLLQRGIRGRLPPQRSALFGYRPHDAKIRATINRINQAAWMAIEYPNTVFDEQARQWMSDAEISYTAFASTPAHATHGRLIVRRVRGLAPRAAAEKRGELFAAYRYHAVFTDSPCQRSQAESHHLAAMSSSNRSSPTWQTGRWHTSRRGSSTPTPSGCKLAATAHTLTRALGVLASPEHALAGNATIRTQLINVAACSARAGHDTITWHVPPRLALGTALAQRLSRKRPRTTSASCLTDRPRFHIACPDRTTSI